MNTLIYNEYYIHVVVSVVFYFPLRTGSMPKPIAVLLPLLILAPFYGVVSIYKSKCKTNLKINSNNKANIQNKTQTFKIIKKNKYRTCTCWANELFKYSAGKSLSAARPVAALAVEGRCNCAKQPSQTRTFTPNKRKNYK